MGLRLLAERLDRTGVGAGYRPAPTGRELVSVLGDPLIDEALGAPRERAVEHLAVPASRSMSLHRNPRSSPRRMPVVAARNQTVEEHIGTVLRHPPSDVLVE
jgi:hypothetical protein